MKKVIIIGAGASGIMAALWAAREGADVTVLEQNSKPLKKLSVTGNGRCNLTNLSWTKNCIRGSDEKKIKRVIDGFDHIRTIEFFEELGIPTKDRNGWVYPINDSASVTAKQLIFAAQHFKIKLKTNERVVSITKTDDIFEIRTSGWTYKADSVVVAVGSPASVKEEGYSLTQASAKAFGISFKKYLPALTYLKSADSRLSKWAGVRSTAALKLLIDNKNTASEEGELQLISNGISGIPVFQVSRYAAAALDKHLEVKAVIDFLPNMSEERLGNYFKRAKEQYPEKSLQLILSGLLPKKLAGFFVDLYKNERTVISALKQFELEISGSGGLDSSQTAMGGIELFELSDDMEALKCRGLFFAGEAVDADGSCGGYNLQWAWSSGKAAGSKAAKK